MSGQCSLLLNVDMESGKVTPIFLVLRICLGARRFFLKNPLS